MLVVCLWQEMKVSCFELVCLGLVGAVRPCGMF
jgi:hypothetical protein